MKVSKIIAACGNNCAACPRYNVHPCEKTEAELHHTAELWMKIGYRDRIVSNEEIACTGCSPENWCRYRIVKCCAEKGIPTCSSAYSWHRNLVSRKYHHSCCASQTMAGIVRMENSVDITTVSTP